MINKAIDNYKSSNLTNSLLEPKSTKLSIFRVINVRPEERTIDIEYVHSNIKERKVNYASPLLSNDSGMDFVPSIGDVGVVASTAVNGKIILGFLGGYERSSGIKLLEGELLLKSKLNAVSKFDNGGNIIMTTEGGTSIFLGKDGKYIMTSSSIETSTKPMEEFIGVDENGNFKFEQNFFEDSVELDYENIENLIEAILKDDNVDLKDRSPIVNISAVTKIKEDGTEQKIDINFDESDDVVAYSISIKNKESGNEISSLTFDKSGNIEIKGNKLIFKVSDIIHK
jgi:hypothetical protein